MKRLRRLWFVWWPFLVANQLWNVTISLAGGHYGAFTWRGIAIAGVAVASCEFYHVYVERRRLA